jgi:hypothetical protein
MPLLMHCHMRCWKGNFVLTLPCPALDPGLLAAVEAEFDATAAKKDLTRLGEEPRLRVARCAHKPAGFGLACAVVVFKHRMLCC